MNKQLLLISICVVVWQITASPNEIINKNILNESVERSIDLTSQLAKISVKIRLKNDDKSAIKYFIFAENPEEKGFISHISVKDSSKVNLKLAKISDNGNGVYTRIHLAQPLQSGKIGVYTIEYVLIRSLIPHPATVTQREKQLVRFFTTQHFYSPYKTESDSTSIKLSSKNIENYTKKTPSVLSESTITYGPYQTVAPFSNFEISVHFENNAPFLTVTKLTRTIEVSHWGNIAVEENIDMLHTGAQLKGPFSRYEYQRDTASGQASIKSFKTILPASAFGTYYRDMNGNISTSHMKVKKDAVELDLRPRYPLFGGWKTRYVLGYNVPSYEYLYNDGDEYLLKMRLIDHIFDDMIVDEVTTKIILPEGSSTLKLSTPFEVERHSDSLHYTYLDTKGRPVISFSKRNLVENHIQDFQLSYKFPKLLMLQEPLLVFIFLYLLFLSVIIYIRLDFSIYKSKQD